MLVVVAVAVIFYHHFVVLLCFVLLFVAIHHEDLPLGRDGPTIFLALFVRELEIVVFRGLRDSDIILTTTLIGLVDL